MAYVKHEWECGDILTPELMNHIEEGIEEASAASSPVKSKIKILEKTAQITVDRNARRAVEIPLPELQDKTPLGVLGALPVNMEMELTAFEVFTENDSWIGMAQIKNPTASDVTTDVRLTIAYLDE